MEANKAIYSKWIIDGLPDYVFGSDCQLYRFPFKSGRNHFGLRKIKKQAGNRWKVRNSWWPERQLKSKIRINENPEILISENEYQF